jgi:hypothetical protein
MKTLHEIIEKYPTDKLAHGYIPIYQKYFEPIKYTTKKVLEIGLFNGNSQLMWKSFFPNAQIYALDNLEFEQSQTAYQTLSDVIHIKVADQANRQDLELCLSEFGGDFDVIIDDGGHLMDQQQISLGFLFPYLKPGGLYVVEDLHTSFMPNAGINEESTNRTYHLLDEFKKTGKIKSPHMTRKEIAYLETAAKNCNIYHPKNDNNHITSVITKKEYTSEDQDITVVYYAYLNPGKWETIVKGQLASLKESKLDSNATVHIVLCGEDSDIALAKELIDETLSSAWIHQSNENKYELPAIHLLWTLANKNPDNLYLYFHTKGVVRGNGYRLPEEKKLFSEIIMPWCRIKTLFKDKKINKIGYASSPSGFFWYNFWWARGDYISKCLEPVESGQRHFYESWVQYYKGFPTSSIDCYSLADEKLGASYMPGEADQKLYANVEVFNTS